MDRATMIGLVEEDSEFYSPMLCGIQEHLAEMERYLYSLGREKSQRCIWIYSENLWTVQWCICYETEDMPTSIMATGKRQAAHYRQLVHAGQYFSYEKYWNKDLPRNKRGLNVAWNTRKHHYTVSKTVTEQDNVRLATGVCSMKYVPDAPLHVNKPNGICC